MQTIHFKDGAVQTQDFDTMQHKRLEQLKPN